MRTAEIIRNTAETKIQLKLEIYKWIVRGGCQSDENQIELSKITKKEQLNILFQIS